MAKKIKSIPAKVKIGYFDYKIKANSDLVMEMGLTKVDKLLIEVDPSYPDQIVKETLLHECMHAIFKDTFLVDDETEEKIIRMLSPGVMHLLKDNPDLQSYLFG